MIKTRSEIPEKDRWNVEALYSDPTAWKKEFLQVQGMEKGPHWPTLKSFQGRLSDPLAVSSLFEFYFDLDRQLSKLYTYAYLRRDEDLGDDEAKRNFGLISALHHDFQFESSWIEPEILSLSDGDFQQLLSHSSLNLYQFYLERVGRMRPHTLSPPLEELLALSGQALDAPHKAFEALENADLVFKPAMDGMGREYPLSNGTFSSYLRSSDRELRKTAFQHLHQGFEAHANTFTELLQGEIQNHLFIARARNFENCLCASLYPHAIDPVVYENLIATVRRYLPLMHEYVALRKKYLKLDQVHVYDLYVPLVEEVNLEIGYPEACKTVIAAVAPLGKGYQEILKKGLCEERWVDPFENARKRSGAYCGGCFDSMPYILMNYQNTVPHAVALAHEVGHGMHRFFSDHQQPYLYSQHPLFVAEVASIFNEFLLLNHMKAQAKNKKERAFFINEEIERIRAALFRQTLFTEFEWQLHRWAEEGVPFTPALLKEKYLELNREYYGPDLVLDPELAIEWARIPHFYYNFYVYQYATGLSAAFSLYNQVTTSLEARDRYLQFLSSGGSRYPLELLSRAGVDMRTPAPIEAALKRFEELVVELKKYL